MHPGRMWPVAAAPRRPRCFRKGLLNMLNFYGGRADRRDMTERRAELRMLCSDLIDVQWKDKSGRQRKATANLEDISHSGVCLQLDIPIPPETELRISHRKAEFLGRVRYCLYRDIGYFLGVQFAPGCRWSPRQYRPAHLLDLRRLVARSAKRALKQAEDAAQAG